MNSQLYNHTLVFTRTERNIVSNIAVVLLSTPDESAADAFGRLRRAVTDWLDNTESGRDAYADSSEDFNIGDLALDESNQELAVIMVNHEIHGFSMQTLDYHQAVDFDKHLHL
jgi:hypothetical protein